MSDFTSRIHTSPRAILFDFDGVLANTENAHVAAWQRTFRRIGLEIGEDTCTRAVEEDDRSFFRSVLQDRDLSTLDLEGWVRWKQNLTCAMLRHGDWLYDGAKPLVQALAMRGLMLGIVTSTNLASVEAVLGSAGLLDRFAVIVAQEDVDKPKPESQGYLLALQRMNLPPEAVIALEDSLRGIEAAIDAGIGVIAVGHRLNEGGWCEGQKYLANFKSLATTLQAMGLE
jgi:HAD superfamily hydrolase (TIGR01509 family)